MVAQTNRISRVAAVVVGGALMAFAFSASAGTKVIVCHATSSDTNSIVVLDISEQAVQAHLEHGDALYDAEEGCGGGGGPSPV